MHRQLIPGYRGQLPLAHQAAIVAAGLQPIGVAIVMAETRFQVPLWTLISVAVAISASAILPFLVALRPRVAVVVGALAAGVSPGAIPVLAFVGHLGLRAGARRPPWAVVPMVGAALALGFGIRNAVGIAPGIGSATLGSLIGVCIVLGSLNLILRSRAQSPVTPPVDTEWLSRRIHDGVGHRLALLSLQARVQSSTAIDADPRWEFVANEIERTFADLRGLLDEIDERVVGSADDPGFALDEFIVEARRAGAPVLISGRHLLDRMDHRDADVVAAVIREGVANAAKYAGPGHVHVRIERESPCAATVQVRSPLGPLSAELSGGGHGLDWLRRRIELTGGAIVSLVDGHDFVLRARVGLTGATWNVDTSEIPLLGARAETG